MMRFYVLLAFTLLSIITKAQTGTIKIKIVDEQNLNLPGASAVIDNSRFSAISAKTGIAIIYNVPSGSPRLLSLISVIKHTSRSLPTLQA